MTYFAFRNTEFKGVYKDLNVYKEIIQLYPEASYRKFQKKDEKQDALNWAGVERLSKTKDYHKKKNQLGINSKKTEDTFSEVHYQLDFPFYFERSEFVLNDFITLIPVEWNQPILTSWDSYEYQDLREKKLNNLNEAYEIVENDKKTGVIVYFLHDLDIFELIDLLLIPSEFKEVFDRKYKEFFIQEIDPFFSGELPF